MPLLQVYPSYGALLIRDAGGLMDDVLAASVTGENDIPDVKSNPITVVNEGADDDIVTENQIPTGSELVFAPVVTTPLPSPSVASRDSFEGQDDKNGEEPDDENEEEPPASVAAIPVPKATKNFEFKKSQKERTKAFHKAKLTILAALEKVDAQTGCYGVVYLRRYLSNTWQRLTIRADNDIAARFAQLAECVTITTAVHDNPDLNMAVKEAIMKIMDAENLLRILEMTQ